MSDFKFVFLFFFFLMPHNMSRIARIAALVPSKGPLEDESVTIAGGGKSWLPNRCASLYGFPRAAQLALWKPRNPRKVEDAPPLDYLIIDTGTQLLHRRIFQRSDYRHL